MSGDVAATLLKIAGHSGTVPSALRAVDIPASVQLKAWTGFVMGVPDTRSDNRDPFLSHIAGLVMFAARQHSVSTAAGRVLSQ